MNKILLTLALAATTLTASAVPAYRAPRTLRLADGTTVVVSMHGDENHSWFSDAKGNVIEFSTDGRTAHRTTRTEADEILRHATAKARAPRRIGSATTAPLPAAGSPRVPVVLVNFTDSTFSVGLRGEEVITSEATFEETRAYYDRFCNGTEDGERHAFDGNYGSIRDYFRDQSDGKFTPQFTVIGPVNLNKPTSYYGENTDGGKDKRYSEFCKDAIKAATAAYDGDWMDFDNKQKNQVDMIFFIFAGTGENTSPLSTLIWPKESTNGTTINGIKFATTGCCSENSVTKFNGNEVLAVRADGIGVFCHELSHALGMPDFYDTNYKAFGMDIWSLMDYGCYAGSGRRPGGYTSYEREFMGWREMQTISEWGTYTLKPTDEGGVGLKLVNPENPDEYYVLENRQHQGWDRSICQRDSGMLVIHVDFKQSKWNSNNVNTDPTHQLMTIIAANNRYIGTTGSYDIQEIIETWSGNLYPFTSKPTADNPNPIPNDSLTALSTPAATVFTAAGTMGTDINNIRLNPDKTVTFYLGNDWVNAIRDIPVSPAASSSTYYDLSGRPVSAPSRPGLYLHRGRKLLLR